MIYFDDINVFIHPFIQKKYEQNPYYVLSTILGTGDTTVIPKR